MSILAEIEAAAEALAPAQAEHLFQRLTQRLRHPQGSPQPRIAELHPGAIEMALNFDAPLPDEFWSGGNPRPFGVAPDAEAAQEVAMPPHLAQFVASRLSYRR
jgi:hypothetical protein